jgi:hypothetical protein
VQISRLTVVLLSAAFIFASELVFASSLIGDAVDRDVNEALV